MLISAIRYIRCETNDAFLRTKKKRIILHAGARHSNRIPSPETLSNHAQEPHACTRALRLGHAKMTFAYATCVSKCVYVALTVTLRSSTYWLPPFRSHIPPAARIHIFHSSACVSGACVRIVNGTKRRRAALKMTSDAEKLFHTPSIFGPLLAYRQTANTIYSNKFRHGRGCLLFA